MKNAPKLPNLENSEGAHATLVPLLIQALPKETWEKYLPHEVIIFLKFHKNWAKIVDFLLGHSDFRITFLIKLRLYLFRKPKAILIECQPEIW